MEHLKKLFYFILFEMDDFPFNYLLDEPPRRAFHNWPELHFPNIFWWQPELHVGEQVWQHPSSEPGRRQRVSQKKSGLSICNLKKRAIPTLSRSEMDAFNAPSGRPKGKQNLKFVNWCSSKILRRSLMWLKLSFSSWVTVPTPSGLEKCNKAIHQ